MVERLKILRSGSSSSDPAVKAWQQSRVQELQEQLKTAELEEALEEMKATLHSVTPEELMDGPQEPTQLGPTITTTVYPLATVSRQKIAL